MDPGISTLADTPYLIKEYLGSLIDFAKVTLSGEGKEKEFGDYPIYFKATGGMRELPLQKREEILKYVRKYLGDKSLCPFFFRDDFARVISGITAHGFLHDHPNASAPFLGEEEAIYSWAATNFLMGNLLPASEGTGPVTAADLNSSCGTLDLGALPQDLCDSFYAWLGDNRISIARRILHSDRVLCTHYGYI